MATAKDIKQIFDFDLFGGFNSQGEIKTLNGKDAWINAFKCWLLNKEGDFLRQPTKGGFLFYWLLKPLSDDNAENIKISLKEGIKNEFTPTLILDTISVIADYNLKKWNIKIQGKVPEIDEYIDFNEEFFTLV